MSLTPYLRKARSLTGLLARTIKFNLMVSSARDHGPLVRMKLASVKYPFYLRKNSSDITAFYQIFNHESYKIDFAFEPKVIFDCGANIGLAAIYLKNKFPNAKIIAVEPESSNFEILKMNTEQYSDIHCLQSGIWDKVTNLKIIDRGLGHWGFITEETDHEDASTVRAISIDGLMKKYQVDHIDVLKLDIESSEKEVFDGHSEEWLPKTKVLLIEVHDGMKPGCTQSVFKAISRYRFVMDHKGENIIIKME